MPEAHEWYPESDKAAQAKVGITASCYQEGQYGMPLRTSALLFHPSM